MNADTTGSTRRTGGASLALTAVVAVGVVLALPDEPRAWLLATPALVCLCSAVAATVIGRVSSDDGWPGAGHFAAGLWLMALGTAGFLVAEIVGDPKAGPSSVDVIFLLPLLPFAIGAHREYRAHLDRRDLPEVEADVVLLAVSVAAILYPLMRPTDADAVTSLSALVFVIVASSFFAMFSFLAFWAPSWPHLMLFVIESAVAIGAARFGFAWTHGMFDPSSPMVWGTLAFTPLLLAALITFSRPSAQVAARPGRVARPILSTLPVIIACGALAFTALTGEAHGLSQKQSAAMIGILCFGIAARIAANQLTTSRTNRDLRDALADRESALRETDVALGRVHEVNETLRQSEEHLRLVFDTAADGIIELSTQGVIMRANLAFCRMVGLDRTVVEGQPWTAVAASMNDPDGSFATLPVTGEASLVGREGNTIYLEASASVVPTDPPLRILVVRDDTASKVADQTIRSLFQFLQDRDEDRTRLMRRTNAAIEGERNRIARDLHDGPVQGVSAASLSLEAALLMFRAGDVDRGTELLTKLREELAGEADALRRLMSGLRPPVLEERGLIPALRDTLGRFGAEHGVQTRFSGTVQQDVPADLETLAFRIVQEAITNAAKHADSRTISVNVTSDPSQLRVEVEDDGRGFDTSNARDFLRGGRVGLASMRERVELASGTFTVRSTPGRGTSIVAVLPLDDTLIIREMAPNEVSRS